MEKETCENCPYAEPCSGWDGWFSVWCRQFKCEVEGGLREKPEDCPLSNKDN